MAAETVARRFVEALRALERDRDLDPIVPLFADDCEVGNLASPRALRGRAGAREFWSTYRGTFGEMESRFRNVIVDGDRASLEWTTTGTSAAGAPVRYDGVSILEARGGEVVRFRAYFDPGDLGRQVAGP